MSNALLLGSGMVAGPLVRYLLDNGVKLTIASPLVERSRELVAGHPGGTVVDWTLSDSGEELDRMIAAHRLAISLLPADMHVPVAQACIRQGRDMVTTSYVSPEMRALDDEAQRAGVLLLNELGVDPGLDHMSALRMIHQVQGDGGEVTAFRSYCGGLPAPQSNDNPWGYKFSWSPLGVLRAGTNRARYLKGGELVLQGPHHIFLDTHTLTFDEVGSLEAYPNRDSVSYAELYGLESAHTLYRGTLRYPGWCKTLHRLAELGLLDARPRRDLDGLTWAQLMTQLCGGGRVSDGQVHRRVAATLWLEEDDPVLERMRWLGLLSDRPLDPGCGSIMEALAALMQERMVYGPGQQDMIVMRHEVVARGDRGLERICSILVDQGLPNGDSSMSRTVSLPAAIAARRVLAGELDCTGVQIPTTPHIYLPILDELEQLGIALKETRQPL